MEALCIANKDPSHIHRQTDRKAIHCSTGGVISRFVILSPRDFISRLNTCSLQRERETV
jgi:hypothetical protein